MLDLSVFVGFKLFYRSSLKNESKFTELQIKGTFGDSAKELFAKK